MPDFAVELSTSSTSTISSPALLLRLSVETFLINAIKSVLRFVVMRETSATDRGGTGCCGMRAQSSMSFLESPFKMVVLDFERSTRKGIGVEICFAAVKVSNETFDNAQTEAS